MLHLVQTAPCTKVVGTFGRGGDLFDRTFSLSFFPGRLLNRYIHIICSFCFGYSSFRCSARSFREFSISAGSVSQCGPQPIRCIPEKSPLLSPFQTWIILIQRVHKVTRKEAPRTNLSSSAPPFTSLCSTASTSCTELSCVSSSTVSSPSEQDFFGTFGAGYH